MPWELTIVRYDGPPPRVPNEERRLPLGTLDEVRAHFTQTLPGMEWQVEPSVIEMMTANGSQLWKEWDEVMIAHMSQPSLNAIYERGDLYLEFFGFEQPEPLTFVHVNIRGSGNPIPVLKSLCDSQGWTVREIGEPGEVLDLSAGVCPQWENWQRYLASAIEQSGFEDSEEEDSI